MKILIDRDNLQKALAVVARAVGKSNIPALNGVLLKTQDGHPVLTANNMETEIRGSCFAEVEGEGAVIVPAKFVDIVKVLPAPDVAVSVDELKLTVKSGDTTFVLHGMDADEFPAPEYGEPKAQFTLSDLSKIAAKTLFATDQADAADFKRGVLFWCKDGELKCMATDTYRLVEYMTPIKVDYEFRFLLPGKSLATTAAVFGNKIIACSLYNNSVEFRDEIYSVTCRLFEDRFPNFSSAWPQEHETTVTAPAEQLRESLSRAALVAGKNNTIKMSVEGNNLEISARSETGSMNERIDIEKTGEDVAAYWNVKFLLEGLRASGEPTIHFNGELGPAVMEAESHRYLVLPVKAERW